MREASIRGMMSLVACCSACFAQSEYETTAHRQIDAGNQAWIKGMKQGEAESIAATYTLGVVDCSQTGGCIQGRVAIERDMTQDMAKAGKAKSASVNSIGSIRQGHFVYEWGRAEASFPDGSKILDKYLTARREDTDGGWKIFRNLVIPAK